MKRESCLKVLILKRKAIERLKKVKVSLKSSIYIRESGHTQWSDEVGNGAMDCCNLIEKCLLTRSEKANQLKIEC